MHFADDFRPRVQRPSNGLNASLQEWTSMQDWEEHDRPFAQGRAHSSLLASHPQPGAYGPWTKEETESLSADRTFIMKFMNSWLFEVMSGVTILINAVIVARDTDTRAACVHQTATKPQCPITPWVEIGGRSCLCFYCMELLLRLWAYRWTFFRNPLNRFDFFLVTTSVILEFVGDAVNFVSIFRMFRILRLAKILRVLIHFRELYLMVYGFMGAMKAIFWAAILMCILLSVWSIFAVEILHPINMELVNEGYYDGWCHRCPHAFETVMQSNLTFLQTIIVGDSWGALAIPLIERRPLLALLFVGIISTVMLGFANLILAVIVDTAAEARNDDITYQLKVQQMSEDAAMQQFIRICSELDDDNKGGLTLNEFKKAWDTSKEFTDALKFAKIERRDLTLLFQIMDEDKSGTVDYHEFADRLHKLRKAEVRTMLMFMRFELWNLKMEVRNRFAGADHSRATSKMRVAVPAEESPRDRLQHSHKHRADDDAFSSAPTPNLCSDEDRSGVRSCDGGGMFLAGSEAPFGDGLAATSAAGTATTGIQGREHAAAGGQERVGVEGHAGEGRDVDGHPSKCLSNEVNIALNADVVWTDTTASALAIEELRHKPRPASAEGYNKKQRSSRKLGGKSASKSQADGADEEGDQSESLGNVTAVQADGPLLCLGGIEKPTEYRDYLVGVEAGLRVPSKPGKRSIGLTPGLSQPSVTRKPLDLFQGSAGVTAGLRQPSQPRGPL